MQRADKPNLLNRLRRIEGQVRGVARMVEDDRYCIDVLTQIQAARAALGRVESELLKGHLDHCIEFRHRQRRSGGAAPQGERTDRALGARGT